MKRMLALLLTAMLILTLLPGCGKKDPGGDAPEVPENPTEQGGRWLKEVYVPLEEMPVYVRENAVIPIYPEEVNCTDEMDLSKSIALRIDHNYKGFWTK